VAALAEGVAGRDSRLAVPIARLRQQNMQENLGCGRLDLDSGKLFARVPQAYRTAISVEAKVLCAARGSEFTKDYRPGQIF
jgi:hypothetical protein